MFVPVFQGHDDAVGLLRHGLVQVLALLVVFIDALCMLAGCVVVLLYEQSHGLSSGLHASGGMESSGSMNVTYGADAVSAPAFLAMNVPALRGR